VIGEVQPEELRDRLESWAGEHGGVVRSDVRPGRVTYTAADGARLACDPPFPPFEGVATGSHEGFVLDPLVEHAARERVAGVILVGARGHAAGVFAGARLVDSAIGGRAGRDAPRAADTAAHVLLPHRDDLDVVVLAGERRGLAAVVEDPRLRGLMRLAGEEIIDVGDHRLQNLRRLPERFRATRVRPA
jgi:hypothetical protein